MMLAIGLILCCIGDPKNKNEKKITFLYISNHTLVNIYLQFLITCETCPFFCWGEGGECLVLLLWITSRMFFAAKEMKVLKNKINIERGTDHGN